jgi:MHS family proline/betaine transporter-like MFS transporter
MDHANQASTTQVASPTAIRRAVVACGAETPAFERTVRQEVTRSPLRTSFSDYPVPLFAAFGLSIVGCVVNYVIFLPVFAQQTLKIPASATFASTLIAGVIYLVGSPLTGALTDRIGRKPMFFITSGSAVVLAYPMLQLLASMPTVGGLFLMQACAALILTFYNGPICAMLDETFPTRIRYTALSISYGFAVAIFGGFAPMIATALIKWTGNPLAPSFYVMLAGVASFIATMFITERAGRPLPEDVAEPFLREQIA